MIALSMKIADLSATIHATPVVSWRRRKTLIARERRSKPYVAAAAAAAARSMIPSNGLANEEKYLIKKILGRSASVCMLLRSSIARLPTTKGHHIGMVQVLRSRWSLGEIGRR
jgi:hypothetical protein